LLQSLQRGELSDAEMNPFFFSQPVAPFAALQKNHRDIRLSEVIKHIDNIGEKCDCLLIEGSGGLMVPLGKRYTVGDLIFRLDARIIVVARNQLGTINHTLLTINALRANGAKNKNLAVALMSVKKPDASSTSNRQIIEEYLSPIPVLCIPFLGSSASRTEIVKSAHKKVKTFLKKLLKSANS